MQIAAVKDILGCDRHRAELVAVEALIGDPVHDDNMALCIDSGLRCAGLRGRTAATVLLA